MGGSIIFRELEEFAYSWTGLLPNGSMVGGYGESEEDCKGIAGLLGVAVGSRKHFLVAPTPQPMLNVAQRAESARLRLILSSIETAPNRRMEGMVIE